MHGTAIRAPILRPRDPQAAARGNSQRGTAATPAARSPLAEASAQRRPPPALKPLRSPRPSPARRA
eukprot:2031142-Alexandrium_andersonii.AAC.1